MISPWTTSALTAKWCVWVSSAVSGFHWRSTISSNPCARALALKASKVNALIAGSACGVSGASYRCIHSACGERKSTLRVELAHRELHLDDRLACMRCGSGGRQERLARGPVRSVSPLAAREAAHLRQSPGGRPRADPTRTHTAMRGTAARLAELQQRGLRWRRGRQRFRRSSRTRRRVRRPRTAVHARSRPAGQSCRLGNRGRDSSQHRANQCPRLGEPRGHRAGAATAAGAPARAARSRRLTLSAPGILRSARCAFRCGARRCVSTTTARSASLRRSSSMLRRSWRPRAASSRMSPICSRLKPSSLSTVMRVEAGPAALSIVVSGIRCGGRHAPAWNRPSSS